MTKLEYRTIIIPSQEVGQQLNKELENSWYFVSATNLGQNLILLILIKNEMLTRLLNDAGQDELLFD